MKNIIITLSLLVTSLSLSAQEVSPVSTPAQAEAQPVQTMNAQAVQQVVITPYFGYISYDEVMAQMAEYKQAQASIEKLKTYYDQEMDRAEQEFSKKFSEYIDGFQSFPENIMLKRQKELQQLMDQSIKFKDEAKQLLSKSENDLIAPVKARLNEAIKAVGTQMQLDYILNIDNNSYPFVNINRGVDVTNAVLNALR